MRRLSPLAIGLAISLAMAACSKSNEEAKTPQAPPAEPAAAATAPTADSAAIDAAVASADRSAEDKERDARSRPAEVLTFMELRPDQHALDYFAAAGYYTELMSRVVGSNGKVIAYNNPEYRKFSQDGPTKRYGNNRLPNVTEVTTPVESVQLEPASLDAVLFMQGYHDLYWRPKDGSWPQTDPAKALAQIVPALKPIIKRDFEAAGLKFDSESPAFASSADDHSKEVFDKAIRHKTDQVMYKFRKS
jgi:predicted methyltransferase